MARELTPEEVAALGLESAPSARELSPEEIAKLELEPRERSVLEDIGEGTRAGLRGFEQGSTLGFADEALGWLASKAPGLNVTPEQLWEHVTGKGVLPKGQGYQQEREEYRRLFEKERVTNPWAYGAGELVGAIASPIPGPGKAKGLAKALRLAAQGAGLGGAYGLGFSKADLTKGELSEAARDVAAGAALGGAFGGGLGLGGAALEKIGLGAGKRVAAAQQEIEAAGAAKAAEETATLRSKAGRAAQDVYKQLEHLRETGRLRHLTPNEAHTAALLEEELGQKAVEKLGPSVAEKEATSAAYKEALATGEQRAAKAAEEIANPWRQILPRAKRYILPGLGTAIGTAVGGPVGASVGALMGAGTRPMMHSVLRGAQHPAVRKLLWRALEKASGVPGKIAPPLSRAVLPAWEREYLLPALTQNDEASPEAIIAALREANP